jgi:cytochrome c oxidase subunit II
MNPQSVLQAAGPQAHRIETLWWLFVGLLAAIWVVTIVLTILPAARRNPAGLSEPNLGAIVGSATGASVLILIGLTVVSVVAGRGVADADPPADSLVLEVTGSQWWWYVRYRNDDPSRIVVTANEIHIPVGRPVAIRGTSLDVIHSFWVPNLQGKRDLIPGHTTVQWFQADRPGRFRAQCAEFCGLQHANMGMWVVAADPGEFDAWMEKQLAPSREPTDAVQRRGREVFLGSSCAMCHAIGGTPAFGQNGPDLTHLASRLTIAAGTLPNTRDNLAKWVADPQSIKPGTRMPVVQLSIEDRNALAGYLGSLQ